MQKISFSEGWQFTRVATGETYTVALPHDATISEPRDPNIRIGYLCAFYHGGRYEYVKKFMLPQEWIDRAVYIEFEGIYRNSEVYVNGAKVSSLVNGYTIICERIDKYLKKGENEICVTIDTPYTDHSRWYAGSGILRLRSSFKKSILPGLFSAALSFRQCAGDMDIGHRGAAFRKCAGVFEEFVPFPKRLANVDGGHSPAPFCQLKVNPYTLASASACSRVMVPLATAL